MTLKEDICEECKIGKMKREYVTNEMIFWRCSNEKCKSEEAEDFFDLDDDGWNWLRNDWYKR